MLIAFHKPFGVLSQFTQDGSSHRTLADYSFPARVYPIGRLDADSEGLLLLSDEPGLNTRLLDPAYAHPRTYWAQVERTPSPDALASLESGLLIRGHHTLPCTARLIHPEVPPRDPPIRHRLNVPTAWIELVLREGKNRQVRRMTAAIGHPTLRLIRTAIGYYPLGDLPAGTWTPLSSDARHLALATP